MPAGSPDLWLLFQSCRTVKAASQIRFSWAKWLVCHFWIYSSINLSMAFWTVYYYRTVGNPFWERSGTVDIYHYKVYCNTLSLSFEIKAFELQMIKYIHTPSETRIFLAFCQYRLGREIFDILHYFFAVIKALSQLKSPLPSSKCHWAAASLDAWEWICRSHDCREQQSQALCYMTAYRCHHGTIIDHI